MQLYRVGIFFILVGIFILMLFGFGAKAGAGNAGLLFWGLLILAVGLVMFLKGPKPKSQSSGRFSILKKGRRKPPKPRWEEEAEEEDEEER